MNNLIKQNQFLDIFDKVLSKDLFNGVMPDIKIELLERENEYELVSELPGVNKEDVGLDFTKDGYLVIEAEKKSSLNKEVDRLVYSELREFNSKRKFYFGNSVKGDSIRAKFENGLLRVVLPKMDAGAKAQKIVID